MKIEIREIMPSEENKWDVLVKKSPYGTLFHTVDWLKIAEKHTKSKLYLLIGLKGTEVIGLFPIFCQKKLFLTLAFSPPLKTAIPYLGPIIVDYDCLKQNKKESISIGFYEGVDTFIREKINPKYIFIQSPPGFLDCRPFKWRGYVVEPKYEYVIDLTIGVDHILEGLKKEVRKNIKREERRGIVVRRGSWKDLSSLYTSLINRYKEQGRVFPLSKKYLNELFDSFSHRNMELFIAELHGAYMGSIIVTIYNGKISSWVGSVKSKIRGVYLNDLLYWEIIKWACAHNLKYFELIGANNPAICTFKSKYNPMLQIYFQMERYTFLTKIMRRVYSDRIKQLIGRI